MRQKTHRFGLVTLSAALVLAACGGGSDGDSTSSIDPPTGGGDECSTVNQNQFIIDLMNDWYFWYQEVPPLDPEDFDSPEATMAAARFDELDRFSFINEEEENDAFFQEGKFIGVGVSTKFTDSTSLFISQVFPDSPADDAGLERGFEIVEINGRTVEEIVAAGDSVSAAFDTGEEGNEAEVGYLDAAGDRHDVTMVAEVVTIPPVSLATTFDVGGTTVAYLVFRTFVTPSEDALDEAFQQFLDAGATELILDLRYNGGGFVSVAQQLAQQIGGFRTQGEVFQRLTYNDRHTDQNRTLRFQDETAEMSVDSLVVITTGSTASASEMVINSLEPFIQVVTVGSDTFGKPVGSNGFDFCGKVAHPITFQNVNADDFGGYFDGFAPDCSATDELTKALGDETEDSLAEALHFVENGTCTTTRAAQARSHTSPYGPGPLTGWDITTGAVN